MKGSIFISLPFEIRIDPFSPILIAARSHFLWEGNINQSEEVQLMIKCKEENVNKVCNKISEWHSYELPEIIYFRVSANKNYRQWVNSI